MDRCGGTLIRVRKGIENLISGYYYEGVFRELESSSGCCSWTKMRYCQQANDMYIGKTSFASHTKYTAKATQGSTLFMRNTI